MAKRKLAVLLQKIYKDGSIDQIFFKTRAKDVIVDETAGTTLETVVNKVNTIQGDATKVEKSDTNGNIKINGEEVQVYDLKDSGVRPGEYNSVTVDAKGRVISADVVTDWSGTVSGDASNAEVEYETPTARSLPATGENLKTIVGKVTKFLTDLKTLAYTEKVGTTNLDDTLTTFYNTRITTANVTESTSITAAGWVADARAIASLQNQINTINSNYNSMTMRFIGNFNNIRIDQTIYLFSHEYGYRCGVFFATAPQDSPKFAANNENCGFIYFFNAYGRSRVIEIIFMRNAYHTHGYVEYNDENNTLKLLWRE